jgi:FtsP/CotA-like multicopper oxidase with cupredoxin domain
MAATTETPKVGGTEIWEITNTTGDTHPIHIHLIQFQLLSRQKYQVTSYTSAYNAVFPGGTYVPASGPPLPYGDCRQAPYVCGGNIDPTPYLVDGPNGPDANEFGWKDTLRMNPGEVTRIAVRWAPLNTPVSGVSAGTNLYSFDPTVGPGYVWHCHILDHEDNEMMRPQMVIP